MDLRDQIKQTLQEDQNKKSKGFGDTFEKLMILTGIKRLVKWIYEIKIVDVIGERIYGINGFLIMIKKLLAKKIRINNMYLRYLSLTKSFIIRKCPKISKLFISYRRVQGNITCMGG